MQKGPKPAELTVSREERIALEELVRRHQTPQHLAKRGRMILGAADGKRNVEIARELGTSVDTVRKWRMRWLSVQAVSLKDCSVTQRLSDEQRPGRPAQITAEQTCQLIALACTHPKERPISQWTGREIADEVMVRGIIEHISPRHAARLLKKGAPTASDPLLVDAADRCAQRRDHHGDLSGLSTGPGVGTRR